MAHPKAGRTSLPVAPNAEADLAAHADHLNKTKTIRRGDSYRTSIQIVSFTHSTAGDRRARRAFAWPRLLAILDRHILDSGPCMVA